MKLQHLINALRCDAGFIIHLSFDKLCMSCRWGTDIILYVCDCLCFDAKLFKTHLYTYVIIGIQHYLPLRQSTILWALLLCCYWSFVCVIVIWHYNGNFGVWLVWLDNSTTTKHDGYFQKKYFVHWSIFGNVIKQPINQKLRRKKLNSIRIIFDTHITHYITKGYAIYTK